MPEAESYRCRLCLVASPRLDPARLAAALSGGDVASLIIAAEGADTEALQIAAGFIFPQTRTITRTIGVHVAPTGLGLAAYGSF